MTASKGNWNRFHHKSPSYGSAGRAREQMSQDLCFPVRDVPRSGKQKGFLVRKVAVGKRRVGEALYPTNPSMRMSMRMYHKSEAVGCQVRGGSVDNVGSWVWSSQADVGHGAGEAASLLPILLKRFPTHSSVCRFRYKFLQRSVVTLPET